MKKFLLKSLDVILTIILVCSAVYALFNLVMAFLPEEIQAVVYNFLHMNYKTVATFSISSAVNVVVIFLSKLGQVKTKLTLASINSKFTSKIEDNNKLENVLLNRINSMINNANAENELLSALLTAENATMTRLLEANEELVTKEQKERLKAAIEAMKEAQENVEKIRNVESVYEKTEIKEVIVEKTADETSGRI